LPDYPFVTPEANGRKWQVSEAKPVAISEARNALFLEANQLSRQQKSAILAHLL
jgi:hypothetical protein